MATALVLGPRPVNLLCRDSKVMLGLNSGDLSRHQLWRISMGTPRFFDLAFVNEGNAERELHDAIQVWTQLMARLA